MQTRIMIPVGPSPYKGFADNHSIAKTHKAIRAKKIVDEGPIGRILQREGIRTRYLENFLFVDISAEVYIEIKLTMDCLDMQIKK